MTKSLIIALALAAALSVIAGVIVAPGATPGPALAQTADELPAPTGVRAVDGANPGAAVVSWDAVDGAPFYRIGWVAIDDITAAQAEGRDWQDAFAFSDVANRGQTAHTVKGLTPCIQYAFITASLSRRFGEASWSQWVFLTPGAATDSCPAAAGTGTPTPTAAPTPTPTPTPTLTPTPTPRPTPTGTGDYDVDKDGLIEVSNLAQLAAIRADLNGDGVTPAPAYAAAFPNAMPGMGCPDGCIGYELVADLDFDTNGNGEADAGDAYWNDGEGWIPIGDSGYKFTADFGGNNHTIANLYINRSDDQYAGLFGYASGSNIKQVGLVSVDISGGYIVGGLVGRNYDGAISGSYATGSVSGDENVGGLVGYGGGTISGSYATGSVSGDENVGGLVGVVVGYGTITDSYAMGSVSGDENVGGLVGGSSRYGTITDSYATGSVSGDDSVGGLAGYGSSVTISGSYATGSVSGGDSVGGLAGYGSRVTISGSYATGSVSGGDSVGGLVGDGRRVTISGSYATGSVSGSGDDIGGLMGYSDGGAISASYATGNVSGNGDDIGGLVGRNKSGSITTSYAVGRVSASGDTFYIGGLVGYDEDGSITASYWDTQTSGQVGSYGGVGKTTAELQSPAGYAGIYAGWNLDLNGDGGSIDDPWDFGSSRQYPVLKYGGLDVAAQRQ